MCSPLASVIWEIVCISAASPCLFFGGVSGQGVQHQVKCATICPWVSKSWGNDLAWQGKAVQKEIFEFNLGTKVPIALFGSSSAAKWHWRINWSCGWSKALVHFGRAWVHSSLLLKYHLSFLQCLVSRCIQFPDSMMTMMIFRVDCWEAGSRQTIWILDIAENTCDPVESLVLRTFFGTEPMEHVCPSTVRGIIVWIFMLFITPMLWPPEIPRVLEWIPWPMEFHTLFLRLCMTMLLTARMTESLFSSYQAEHGICIQYGNAGM